MVRKVNSFEGGVAGSAITTGNSSAGGDGFNATYIGGGAFTWTDVNVLAGSLSGLLEMVAGQSWIAEWTGFNPGATSAVKSRLGFRHSIRTPAAFATGSTVTDIIQLRTPAKCATLKWVAVSGGTKLGVYDQSSDTVARQLSTTLLAADTEYDVALWAETGSTSDTAGAMKAGLYPKGSNSPIEVLSVAASLGTTPLNSVRFLKCINSAQTGFYRVDNLQAGDDYTDLPLFVVGSPSGSATGSKRYVVDASSYAAGAGGALTFSVAKKSGPTLQVLQRDALFLFVASTTTDAVYTISVSESGGGTATQDVVIPADTGTVAATGYTELVSLGSGGVWT